MIEKLYVKYLLADWLGKKLEAAGVEAQFIKLDNGNAYASDVHIQCGLIGDPSDKGNEEAAVRLLDTIPGLRLERTHGLIYLRGEGSHGLTYDLYTGSGVCEMVQVGTRIVPEQPEQIIPAVPEHEEPVFERRCPDPLLELAVAS